MKFDSLQESSKVVKLENFSFYQEGPGIRNWQYIDDNGIKFINIKCINDFDIQLSDANMISQEEAFGIYKHFLVEERDILVSTSGSLGRMAIARKNHLPLCMNTSVIRFRPKNERNYPYLFCYLMSNNFKNTIMSMASGSAQLNFGPTHIKQIQIALPNDEELESFNKTSQPLIDYLLNSFDKIDKLKSIKAKLLSKYF